MPGKIVVGGVILVFMISIAVSLIEYNIPLSAKSDLNQYCRAALLKMEMNGGISSQDAIDLSTKLLNRGFKNVSVTGTQNARLGDTIHLSVQCDYEYSKLILLSRSNVVQSMSYNRSSVCRKVVNW